MFLELSVGTVWAGEEISGSSAQPWNLDLRLVESLGRSEGTSHGPVSELLSLSFPNCGRSTLVHGRYRAEWRVADSHRLFDLTVPLADSLSAQGLQPYNLTALSSSELSADCESAALLRTSVTSRSWLTLSTLQGQTFQWRKLKTPSTEGRCLLNRRAIPGAAPGWG